MNRKQLISILALLGAAVGIFVLVKMFGHQKPNYTKAHVLLDNASDMQVTIKINNEIIGPLLPHTYKTLENASEGTYRIQVTGPAGDVVDEGSYTVAPASTYTGDCYVYNIAGKGSYALAQVPYQASGSVSTNSPTYDRTGEEGRFFQVVQANCNLDEPFQRSLTLSTRDSEGQKTSVHMITQLCHFVAQDEDQIKCPHFYD